MSEQQITARGLGIRQILDNVLNRSHAGEFDGMPVQRILSEVCLAQSVVELNKLATQPGICGGIQWLYVAVGSWAMETPDYLPLETVDSPEQETWLRLEHSYHALVERFPVLKTDMEWELRKTGGAQGATTLTKAGLFIRGGYNDTEDDSLTLHLVQNIGVTDFPWGDSDSFALRVRPLDVGGRQMLLIYLPGED